MDSFLFFGRLRKAEEGFAGAARRSRTDIFF